MLEKKTKTIYRTETGQHHREVSCKGFDRKQTGFRPILCNPNKQRKDTDILVDSLAIEAKFVNVRVEQDQDSSMIKRVLKHQVAYKSCIWKWGSWARERKVAVTNTYKQQTMREKKGMPKTDINLTGSVRKLLEILIKKTLEMYDSSDRNLSIENRRKSLEESHTKQLKKKENVQWTSCIRPHSHLTGRGTLTADRNIRQEKIRSKGRGQFIKPLALTHLFFIDVEQTTRKTEPGHQSRISSNMSYWYEF